MSVLRFLMLLSLIVWLGGIVFFAFIVAPALFSVLPQTSLAGQVVARVLPELHRMGIVSGIVFLASSILLSRRARGSTAFFSRRNLLVFAMLVLTAGSEFGLRPRIESLRSSMGQVEQVPAGDLRRARFDRLHTWSVVLEGATLLLGLVTIYRIGKEFAPGGEGEGVAGFVRAGSERQEAGISGKAR